MDDDEKEYSGLLTDDEDEKHQVKNLTYLKNWAISSNRLGYLLGLF